VRHACENVSALRTLLEGVTTNYSALCTVCMVSYDVLLLYYGMLPIDDQACGKEELELPKVLPVLVCVVHDDEDVLLF